MSVLENLRKGTDSTSIRLLIGVTVAAFIVWGARGASDRSTGAVATVNGSVITNTEFSQIYRRAERMQQGNLDDAGREALRAQVLQYAIQQEALFQEALHLGIAVSDEEVARELVKNQNFQKDGKFDDHTYRTVLKNMGMTPDKFEIELRRTLLVDKLSELAIGAVAVSDGEVHKAWLEQETQLDLSFIRLPDTAFLADIPITDAEREDVIAKNGDELKKRYDASFDRQFNLPKRYTLSTVLIRTDKPDVDKAAARLRAEGLRAAAAAPGADFATIATTGSEDISAAAGGNLGEMAADQLDPVVRTQADGLGPGQISPVFETGRGWQFIRLEAVAEAKTVSFDEAKAELATQMFRETKVGEVQKAYAARLIEAWKATGVPPVELAAAKKLSVDSTGPFSSAGGNIPTLGLVPALAAALPTAKPGDVLPLPFTSGPNLFVVQLTSRTEPDAAGFDAAKGMVRARLLLERRRDFVESWRDDVVARADVEITGGQSTPAQ